MGFLLLKSVPADAGEVEIVGTVVASDDDGKLNRTSYAQKFNSSQFTFTHASIAVNDATGPDGELKAAALVENGNNNYHSMTILSFRQSGVTDHEAEFVVEAGTRSRCVVIAASASPTPANGVSACIDLANGVLTTTTPAAAFGTGFTFTSCSVTPHGDGSHRIVLRYTYDGSAYLILRADNGSGNAAYGPSTMIYTGTNDAKALYVSYVGASRATSDGTNVAANLIDESGSTRWFGRGLMAYAGLDLGSGKSATFTEVWLANGDAETVETNSDIWFDYPYHMSKLAPTDIGVSRAGILIGDPSTFGTSAATSTLLTQTDYRPRFDYKAFPVSGTGRAIGVRKAGGYLSKFVAFAQADAAIASVSRPARVTITPPGARRASGSIQVTLTSRTTNAQIYYTVDGSTPDNTKTLYSVPFTLPFASNTTLKAVAYDSSLGTPYSVVSSAIFKPTGIVANEDVYDNRGILVEAHGGNIVDGGDGKLYRIGASANFHVVGAFGGLPRRDMDLCLYSCPSDQANAGYLIDWTFEGKILDAPSNGGVYWYSVTRPHIIFNPNTSTWMLYAHADNAALNAGKCVVAESATSDILSAWSWINTNFDPGGVGYKDCNVALDPTDNRIMTIYTSGTQVDTYLSKLAADGRSTDTTIQLNAGASREAHVLFHDGHRNGGTPAHWFWVSSTTYPYSATTDSDARCLVLTGSDPMSGWGAWNTGTAPRIFVDTDISNDVYKNQPCSVFIPSGKDHIVYCGDNWRNTSGANSFYASRDVWLPGTFPTTTTFRVDVSKASTGWTVSDLT